MGSQSFEKVGAEGRTEAGGLFPEQVIGVWQKGHFLFGKVPTKRYDLEDPKMQSLIDSIKAMGWKQPGIAWHFEDSGTTHVICGNRRTFATARINEERLEADQDPIRGQYRIIIRKSLTPAILTEALEIFADTNNQFQGNDWLTVAGAAAHQIAIGVPVSSVLARWPMIESERMLERLIAEDGVRAAAPEIQEALAAGRLPVRKAMKIAKLPIAEQAKAMTAKPKRKPRQGSLMTRTERALELIKTEAQFQDLTAIELLSVLNDEPVFGAAAELRAALGK